MGSDPLISNLSVSRERMAKFGSLIHDENLLHRSQEYALRQGFRDTPVYAVFLEGIVESILRGEIGKRVELGLIQTLDFAFKEPVYPDEEVTFSFIEDPQVGKTSYKIEAKTHQGQALQAKATLAERLGQPEEFASPLYETTFSLDTHARNQFYTLLGVEERPFCSPVHIASCIPAALLRLAKEKTGFQEGVSRRIGIEVYQEIGAVDRIRTTLALIGQPKSLREQGYIYNLRGVCYDRESPILSAEMKVIHPQDLTKKV